MSGGQWGHSGYVISDLMEVIAQDKGVKAKWPEIARIYRTLASWVRTTEHDMDWDLSGDSGVGEYWEKDMIAWLESVVDENKKDERKENTSSPPGEPGSV